MPRCTDCDSHVTPRFAQVFGNNEDVVEGCMDCTEYANLGTHGDHDRFDRQMRWERPGDD